MENNKQEITYEDIIITNMLQIEAIIEILEEKNIATGNEILEKVKRLKTELEERRKKNSNIN